MKPVFKALLAEAVASGNQVQIEATKKAIETETFFVDVVVTSCGQYCMGSSSVDVDGETVDIPNVYVTQEDVQAEIDSEVARYNQDIEDGERDEDDEYEGVLMAMKWDGGTQVEFFEVDNLEQVIEVGAWRWHAGH